MPLSRKANINLGISATSVAAVSLEEKIAQAEALDERTVILSFNIGASTEFSKDIDKPATRHKSSPLMSNKGRISINQNTQDVFASFSAYGLFMKVGDTFQSPPTTRSNFKSGSNKEDVLVANQKPQGLCALLLSLLHDAFNAQMEELSSAHKFEEIPAILAERNGITLADVWDWQIKFDLPMKVDKVMELYDECLNMRAEGLNHGKAMQKTVIVACTIKHYLDPEEGHGVTLKCTEIIDILNTVRELPTGEGDHLTRAQIEALIAEQDQNLSWQKDKQQQINDALAASRAHKKQLEEPKAGSSNKAAAQRHRRQQQSAARALANNQNQVVANSDGSSGNAPEQMSDVPQIQPEKTIVREISDDEIFDATSFTM